VWSLWFAEHHRSLLRSELEVMDSLVSHIEGLVETLARPLSALSRVRYERRLKRERYELSSADIERARLAIGLLLQGGGRFEGSPPAGLINASSKLCHQPQALAQVLAKSASDIEEGSIPTLQRAALRVHQAAASLDKLRATQRPQLELGLQWSAVNDLSLLGGLRDDVLTAQIGGTIPIWRSANGSARASLVAERARREAALRDRSERWRSSTNELIVTLKDQARQLNTLKRELSPLAEETLRQTRHEYEVGLADLSEVYRAELSLSALKRDTLKIQFACALSLARWRSLTQSAPTLTSAEEVSP
jgi:outer membrane protein TolC